MNIQWHSVKLKDLADVLMGQSPRSEYYNVEGKGLPFFQGCKEFGVLYPDVEKFCSQPNRVAQSGDVLMSVRAPVGKLNIADRECCIGRGLCAIRDKSGSRFVYYLLKANLSLIESYGTGTTYQAINKEDVNNMPFKVPSLTSQRKIVSILSAYDDLIENNLRRIKILEELTQNLYREWFVKFRFLGHEKVKIVDSSLGKIPEGCEVKTLGEVASNYDRFRKPLSKMQRLEREGIYPYYGAAKIFDYIDDYIFDGIYLLIAEDGSVITPDRRPVLQYVSGKFWANNHTHILQGKGFVSTEFLYLVLSEFDITGYITGAAQPKITQANLNRIPVLVAKENIHKSFDEFIKDLFRQKIVLGEKNEKLRHSRDLLLPKLISGELDVSDLDIRRGGHLQ